MTIDAKVEESLVEKMGKSWYEVLKPFIQTPVWDAIYKEIGTIRKAGREVVPKGSEVFQSLKLCPRDKVRAIILLQCPYATKRNEVVIANGIPMDCQNIAPYQQPSLFMWYQAIEKQYGFHPDNDMRCDLSYLLAEEGVLLINSALTVELNKVDSMAAVWVPFIQYLLEEVVSKIMCGLPIALVGSQSQKFEQYINPLCHHIIKVEHPAAAAYQNRDWKHGNLHQKINEILKANNGQEIQWLRKKGEEKKSISSTGYVYEESDLPF